MPLIVQLKTIMRENYQKPLVPQVTEEQKQPKEVEKPRKDKGKIDKLV